MTDETPIEIKDKPDSERRQIDRTNRGCRRCHAQLALWERVMCRQCCEELDL